MNKTAMIGLAVPLVILAVGASVPANAGSDTVISTAGGHLVDQNGMSLYLFEPDEHGASTCYQGCAQAWPPLVADGKPTVKGEAKASLLGSAKRKDGTMQVTYGGWPLYHFVKDQKPGDTIGQEKKGFGGEWYLVEPGGSPKE